MKHVAILRTMPILKLDKTAEHSDTPIPYRFVHQFTVVTRIPNNALLETEIVLCYAQKREQEKKIRDVQT